MTLSDLSVRRPVAMGCLIIGLSQGLVWMPD